MRTWWEGLSGETRYNIMMVPTLLALLGLLLWGASYDGRISQHEVTLGDGTRATCIVVQGVRTGGVTCVPHVVEGHDAEEATP